MPSEHDVVVGPYERLSNAQRLDELTDEYWSAADDEWGDKLEAFVVRVVATHVDADGHSSTQRSTPPRGTCP